MEDNKILNVLVACEESQATCSAFRARGHNAFSCDLQECSGGHPEWHINGDVLPIINGNCEFTTSDGKKHRINGKWDLIVAHPPCTYLTVSGNRWFDVNKYGDAAIKRAKDREEGADFFMKFANVDCDHVAIENPIGIMSTRWRKPDQIIQPFQYGHPYTKQTCLWLKGLPKLQATDVLEKPAEGWVNQCFTPDGRYGGFKAFNGSKQRSKTFEGIAKAFADQWGGFLESKGSQSEIIDLDDEANEEIPVDSMEPTENAPLNEARNLMKRMDRIK